jgi:hypothetical protein
MTIKSLNELILSIIIKELFIFMQFNYIPLNMYINTNTIGRDKNQNAKIIFANILRLSIKASSYK